MLVVSAGASLTIHTHADVQVLQGRVVLVSAAFNFGSGANMLLLDDALLQLTDTHLTAYLSGSSLSLSGGRVSLEQFSLPSFVCEPRFSMSGGGFSSEGSNFPSLLNFSSVTMYASGTIPHITAPHADVNMRVLQLFGGLVFCRSLTVDRLTLYSSDRNSVLGSTTVETQLTLEQNNNPGFSITFQDDLTLLDNSSVVWMSSPTDTAAVLVSGQLVLGTGVTLSVLSAPSSLHLAEVPLILWCQSSLGSCSPPLNSFSVGQLPAGWTVKLSDSGVSLRRLFISDTTTLPPSTIVDLTSTAPGTDSPLPLILGASIGGGVGLLLVVLLIVLAVRVKRRRDGRRFLKDDENHVSGGESQAFATSSLTCTHIFLFSKY